MNNILKTFEPNLEGRDFVIGDLHGSFSCLEKLLDGLNFDPLIDRMFSVGDLVDRGPESLKTLGLLRDPWFNPVLSNHEQMMLQAFEGGPWGGSWMWNGGSWGAGALDTVRLKGTPEGDEAELMELLELVKELPYLITVNMADGRKYHIIHAELPAGHFDITDEMLSSPEKVLQLASTFDGDGDAFLWARNIYRQLYRADLANRDKIVRILQNSGAGSVFNDKLSHIISGHTIMQRPMTIAGQTNIDTCAFGSYSSPGRGSAPNWCALTAICLNDWTFYQATATEFRTVEPLVINKAEIT